MSKTRQLAQASFVGALLAVLTLALSGTPALARETVVEDLDGPNLDGGGENASNPLAKVKNTDIRWQYQDLANGNGRINDYYLDGAFMINPRLKLKYELHYWETDVTGNSEHGFEQLLIKMIHFPKEGIFDNGIKYRLAVGNDFIADGRNKEDGIGQGSDQLGPFVGMAFAFQNGLTVIPLVQHFVDVNGGEDINTTAGRLIALMPLPKQMWFKADIRMPYDWENETTPWRSEFQLGKNVNQTLALFVDGLAGVTTDRIFDWGVGVGIRFKY